MTIVNYDTPSFRERSSHITIIKHINNKQLKAIN